MARKEEGGEKCTPNGNHAKRTPRKFPLELMRESSDSLRSREREADYFFASQTGEPCELQARHAARSPHRTLSFLMLYTQKIVIMSKLGWVGRRVSDHLCGRLLMLHSTNN